MRKRTERLQTISGPAVYRGKDTTRKTLRTPRRPCVMSVRGPNNVVKTVQTDPTLLRYVSAITEQKKCRELLAQKFDGFSNFAQ